MNFKIKNKADVSLTGNLNHFIEDLVKKMVTKLFYSYMQRIEIINGMKTTKDVLTTEEVAELLGMNRRSVVEKINQGLIPGYKPPFSKNFLVLKRELISEIMNGSQYRTNKMLENNVKNSIDLRRYSNT